MHFSFTRWVPCQNSVQGRIGKGHEAWSTLCIPLSAQGEMAGLLLLSTTASAEGEEGAESMDASIQSLAVATGQKVALAFSNLQLQAKLRDQAIRDVLTGLYNRRYFEESFEREIKRAERSGASVGLLMIDIDHFKKFNDTVGHQGGDVVLQHVGHLMREASRGEDIPCRYGGEEFALMFSETPLDVLVERAEQLRKSVEALQASLRGQVMKRVTISCGVAVCPQHGTEPQELIRTADAALYEARRQGRNRVVVAPSDQSAALPTTTTTRQQYGLLGLCGQRTALTTIAAIVSDVLRRCGINGLVATRRTRGRTSDIHDR